MNVVYGIQREKRKEKGPSLPVFFSDGRKKCPGKKDEEKSSDIVHLLRNNMNKVFCGLLGDNIF